MEKCVKSFHTSNLWPPWGQDVPAQEGAEQQGLRRCIPNLGLWAAQSAVPDTVPGHCTRSFSINFSNLVSWLGFSVHRPTQLCNSIPGGVKTFWRWSIWVFHHKTLVSARQPPWWEAAAWTHPAEPLGLNLILPKATPFPKSLSHCSGVSLHQLSLKLIPSCTCEGAWTCPPTLEQKKITPWCGDLHFSCFHAKKRNQW